MLDFGDRINATDAMELYDRVHGTITTPFTFRAWLSDEADHHVLGVERRKWEGRWEIDRPSMLDAFEARANRMLVAIEQERGG